MSSLVSANRNDGFSVFRDARGHEEGERILARPAEFGIEAGWLERKGSRDDTRLVVTFRYAARDKLAALIRELGYEMNEHAIAGRQGRS